MSATALTAPIISHEVPDLEVQETIVLGLTAQQLVWFVLALIPTIVLLRPTPVPPPAAWPEYSTWAPALPSGVALLPSLEAAAAHLPYLAPPQARAAAAHTAERVKRPPPVWPLERLPLAGAVWVVAGAVALVRPHGLHLLVWLRLWLVALVTPRRDVWVPNPDDERWRPPAPPPAPPAEPDYDDEDELW